MGWESSGVVGFDLGPLLQGQTRIAKGKSAYNSLLVLEVWDGNVVICMTHIHVLYNLVHI